MSNNKKYYWIKLKTDFFYNEAIDFLLSQPNGCQYVVLYQMLCLRTANSNGTLTTTVGEMTVPFDVNKIVRDAKYFDFDTVTIALGLFKKLGLIYESDNEILKISNYEEIVGSESANKDAERQRKSRAKRKAIANEMSQKSVTNCHTEYRVKSLELRDQSIDNRDESLELREKSSENRDESLELREKSSENRDESLELREKNTDNRVKSLDCKDENLKQFEQQTETECCDVLNLFNAVCLSFEPIDKITDIRKEKILRAKTILKDDFEQFFNRVEKSDFLSGRNGRWNVNGTQATFEWILRPDNIKKIQSGTYDNKERKRTESYTDAGSLGSISQEDMEFLANLGTNI